MDGSLIEWFVFVGLQVVVVRRPLPLLALDHRRATPLEPLTPARPVTWAHPRAVGRPQPRHSHLIY